MSERITRLSVMGGPSRLVLPALEARHGAWFPASNDLSGQGISETSASGLAGIIALGMTS